jgi:hypothetical protein
VLRTILAMPKRGGRILSRPRCSSLQSGNRDIREAGRVQETINGREKAPMNEDESFDEWSARWKREWESSVEASRLFNARAVDRIVTAVGKPLLDHDGFVKELERVAKNYSIRCEVNDRPPDGEVRKWLAANLSAARRLRKLHDRPPGGVNYLAKLIFIASHGRHNTSQFRRAIEMIQVVEVMYGKLLRDKPYGLDRIGSKYAAEHWLIGEALPRVYTQYFGDEFGYSRDKETGVPSGPGIRFMLEVLSIMGVTTPRDGKPFGPDAVEYYLKSAGH